MLSILSRLRIFAAFVSWLCAVMARKPITRTFTLVGPRAPIRLAAAAEQPFSDDGRPGIMSGSLQQYVASARPAFLFAPHPPSSAFPKIPRFGVQWHAFGNNSGSGQITHLWGLSPKVKLSISCQQEAWAAPGISTSASGSPAAILDVNGTAHVFFVSQADGHIWQICRALNSSQGGWYAAPFGNSSQLPPAAASDPAALWTPDGTQHVFYRVAAGGIWHIWWDPAMRPAGGTGTFSHGPWGASDSNIVGSPAAFQSHDGYIHVLYRYANGNIYQTVGQSSGSSVTTYANFKVYHFGDGFVNALGDPSAVVTDSGNQCAVYRDVNNNITMRCWHASDGSWQSGAIFPEGLQLEGDPAMAFLGAEAVLVLAGTSFATSADRGVAVPLLLDTGNMGGLAVSEWSPWCNLPIPSLISSS